MYPSGVSTHRWLGKFKSIFSALTSFSQGKTSSASASRIFVPLTSGRALIAMVPPHCRLVSVVQFRPSRSAFGKSGKRTERSIVDLPAFDVRGRSAKTPRPRPASFRKSRREIGCLGEVMRSRITVNRKEVNWHLRMALIKQDFYATKGTSWIQRYCPLMTHLCWDSLKIKPLLVSGQRVWI